ncbi:hypothetical protein ACS0TY_025990 [Phlomoides rotata]
MNSRSGFLVILFEHYFCDEENPINDFCDELIWILGSFESNSRLITQLIKVWNKLPPPLAATPFAYQFGRWSPEVSDLRCAVRQLRKFGVQFDN